MENNKRQLPYMNPELSVEERVEDLLGRMTLEEKLREMCMYPSKYFEGESGDSIFCEEKAAEFFKGIGIGALEAPKFSPRQNAAYMNAIQKYIIENTRLGIPAIMISEILHGYLTPDATVFPQAIALASTWNKELIKQVSSVIAKEAAACGIRQGLGPDLDLAREPRWGRVEETYGEDPYLVGTMGLSYVKGMQGEEENVPGDKIAVTLKHFCAHGSPEGGVNLSPVPTGDRQLRELYLPPFAKCIREGRALSVMPAYSELDGIPCHGSDYLLNTLLREELEFEGYVFSDYGGVEMIHSFHRAAENYPAAGKQAVEAGNDMEAPESRCYPMLKELIDNGQMDMASIDKAVSRILRVKFLTGLFEHPYVDEDLVAQIVHTEENREFTRKVAQESVILLKNENVLPLSKKMGTLAVIGPNADSAELGDYTVGCTSGVTLLEGIRNHVDPSTRIIYAKGCDLYEKDNIRDVAAWDEAIAAAKQADTIVVAMGSSSAIEYGIGWGIDTNKPVTCGEGYDTSDLGLSGAQEALLEELLKLQKPLVLVLINGRPVTLPCIDKLPALIETWYAGEQAGNAIADILFGNVNPSGKLPITFPKSLGQSPLYYNYKPSARGCYHCPGSPGAPGRDYVFEDTLPMFPFGYGLSYTKFSYSDLSVESKVVPAGSSVRVSVTVENTGTREGAEVVQMYLNDVYSTTTTPIKALRGFEKITLQPEERRTVTFELKPEDLALVDRKYRYFVEEGEFEVMIADLRTTFLVEGSCYVTHMQ